jgi:hypothetical protein
MLSLYYFAAWTDSHCVVGCEHQHETIISATAWCKSAGAYVVAIENGELRELDEKEERQFQYAMYGYDTRTRRLLAALVGVLAFLSRWAGYHC